MLSWIASDVVIPMSWIGFVMFISWLIDKRGSAFAIIRDGQLCSFSTTMLGMLLIDFAKRTPSDNMTYTPFIQSLLMMSMIFAACIYAVAITESAVNPKCVSKLGVTSVLILVVTLGSTTFIRNYFSLF
jgi:hypothetical protein